MIKYVSGNLLNSKCEVFVNPVNCVGVMGAGLAAAFKKMYPKMFLSYREMCQKKEIKIGQVAIYTNSNPPPRLICFFPTKYHWQEKSTLDGVELGLKAFLTAYEVCPFKSAAFPKIGCGLGGLDFIHEVRPLMQFYLDDKEFDIEIYI